MRTAKATAILRIAATSSLWLLPIVGCNPAAGRGGSASTPEDPVFDTAAADNAAEIVQQGQDIFRYDSLGSETFWGDTLRVHETIAGDANGGVGPGISPAAALAVGLKVDSEALPDALQAAILAGNVDLDDPATTIALLELNAVVGLQGQVNDGFLDSIGITCALCHSTVDDSFAPGIGKRLDGWPNRDLDVGTVISLAQDLSHFESLLGATETQVRDVLASWGPGRFDAHLNLDGKAFRPDGASGSVLIPAALGLGGVNLATYTGWGSVPHWNALVGTIEMGGQGRFFDPRLNDPQRFPIAAAAGFGDVTPVEDLVSGKLEALHLYQLAIPIPCPPLGSFDELAAARGKELFSGKADCARCHVPPLYTEPGWNVHTPEEMGIDDFQAMRSPTERYRTTPLRGLSTRSKGGYFHDGQFPDLPAVIDHYEQQFGLQLSAPEKDDLVEFLKSL